MLLKLEFYVKEALIGMMRSKWMFFIAFLTITISLFFLGVFLLLNLNLNHLAKDMRSKLEVRVFLKDNQSKLDIKQLESEIKSVAGVKHLRFLDKQEAWQNFKEKHQQLPIASYNLKNPLPDAFSILLSDFAYMDSLKIILKQKSHLIDDVFFGGKWAMRVNNVSVVLRVGGSLLVLVFGISAFLIVINTIRLTIMARQEEIEIMNLMGATRSCILVPFILEGVFIGFFAACVSVLSLFLTYEWVVSRLDVLLPFMPLLNTPSLLIKLYVCVGLSGLLMGFFGAYVSVSQRLKGALQFKA